MASFDSLNLFWDAKPKSKSRPRCRNSKGSAKNHRDVQIEHQHDLSKRGSCPETSNIVQLKDAAARRDTLASVREALNNEDHPAKTSSHLEVIRPIRRSRSFGGRIDLDSTLPSNTSTGCELTNGAGEGVSESTGKYPEHEFLKSLRSDSLKVPSYPMITGPFIDLPCVNSVDGLTIPDKSLCEIAPKESSPKESTSNESPVNIRGSTSPKLLRPSVSEEKIVEDHTKLGVSSCHRRSYSSISTDSALSHTSFHSNASSAKSFHSNSSCNSVASYQSGHGSGESFASSQSRGGERSGCHTKDKDPLVGRKSDSEAAICKKCRKSPKKDKLKVRIRYVSNISV